MPSGSSSIPAKPGSERSFGVVFAIVFLLIGLYPLLNGAEIRWWCLVVSAAFLIVAAIRPAILKSPNYWWFRFGLLLGNIVSPVVMAAVYFVTIVPLGLALRLMRKDILRARFDRNAKSYWIEREEPMHSLKNQF